MIFAWPVNSSKLSLRSAQAAFNVPDMPPTRLRVHPRRSQHQDYSTGLSGAKMKSARHPGDLPFGSDLLPGANADPFRESGARENYSMAMSRDKA